MWMVVPGGRAHGRWQWPLAACWRTTTAARHTAGWSLGRWWGPSSPWRQYQSPGWLSYLDQNRTEETPAEETVVLFISSEAVKWWHGQSVATSCATVKEWRRHVCKGIYPSYCGTYPVLRWSSSCWNTPQSSQRWSWLCWLRILQFLSEKAGRRFLTVKAEDKRSVLVLVCKSKGISSTVVVSDGADTKRQTHGNSLLRNSFHVVELVHSETHQVGTHRNGLMERSLHFVAR